jgi:hypothetical protein
MVKIDVECPKLDDTNYGLWEPRIEQLLDLEDCSEAVFDGLGEAPDAALRKQDRKARALIGAHLSNQYLSVYKKSATAEELWATLKDMFRQKTLVRRLALRRELNSLRKMPRETISAYFARAGKIRDELLAADDDVQEHHVVTPVRSCWPS